METNGNPKPVVVELDPPEPCPQCGVRGQHFCTGGQEQHGGWVGVQKECTCSPVKLNGKTEPHWPKNLNPDCPSHGSKS